jgi:hypothetical protein
LWLGNKYLFQAFEELDQVKDKESNAGEIRKLLNDEESRVS